MFFQTKVSIALVSSSKDGDKVLSRLLSEQEYTIVNYKSVDEFLDAIEDAEVKSKTTVIILEDIIHADIIKTLINIRELEDDTSTPLTPIIVLTANQDLSDKIECLECGADDYVTKPCTPLELITKVRVLLRRLSHSQLSQDIEYKYKGITLNDYTKEVRVNDKKLNLTKKEYQFLHTLIQTPNRCVSRNKLFDVLWGYDDYHSPSDEANLNTHISSLRRKIRAVDEDVAKLIVTEKCFGYTLSDE